MRIVTGPAALVIISVVLLGVPDANRVAGASADPNPTAPAAIEFQSQPFVSSVGESVAAESGWLVVPENHSRPRGATIKLPIVRFRSTSASPGYPIIYLAGGPGESGLRSAREEIFPVLMALRSRGDVIVYDQRGTGSAEPSLVVPGNFNLPLDAPLASAATRERLLEIASASSAEIRKRGVDLSAYNTNESADDLNDLRVALGAAKINIWGHSYGSHLGLAFLRRHGAFVARAILGGINGPDQRWRYPNDLSALVERLDAIVASVPKLRSQMPSLKQTMTDVFRDFAAKPVTVMVQSQPLVIGLQDLQVLIALQAGDIEFIKGLPAFFGRIQSKDYAQLAALVGRGLKQREIGTLMRYSMHLASGVSPERAAKVASEEKSALLGNAINFPYADPAFRAAWQVTDLGAEFRAPLKSAVPTLFLSGTLDGRTSISDAEEVRQGFSNGRHLIIENASHNFYHLTPQVAEAMLAFLDGKETRERVRIPIELRGPDERALVLELRKIILEKGVGAGLKRMREMNAPDSPNYLTSYVPGILGQILSREEKKPEAALAVYEAAVELFPGNSFLTERLAEASLLAGQKQRALALYRKCLELNPLNQLATLKIKELAGS